jgi:hypothetical protein
VTNARGTFILGTEKTITGSGIEHSNTKLLPKNTTIVTARGTVGSYCIPSREMTINQTNYGLKAKFENEDFFVFFSIANLVDQMKMHSYGTVFDTITTKTFKGHKNTDSTGVNDQVLRQQSKQYHESGFTQSLRIQQSCNNPRCAPSKTDVWNNKGDY